MKIISFAGNIRHSPLRLLRLTEIILLSVLVLLLINTGLTLLEESEETSGKNLVVRQAPFDKEIVSARKTSQAPAALRALFGETRTEEQQANLTEPIRETPLNLKLKGILLQRQTDNRLALIETSDKKEKVYRAGDKIEGAEIVRIAPGRVVLRRNGLNESLSLLVQKLERTSAENTSSLVTTQLQVNEPPRQVYVPKQTLKAKLKNLPEILNDAKTVPYYENGQALGYKVVQINGGSIFQDLGLKQNDILRSVNGFNVRNTKEVLAAYRKLRKAQTFELDLLRDGQEYTINYSVQ